MATIMRSATPAESQPRSSPLSRPASPSRSATFRPVRTLSFSSSHESDDLSKKCSADSPATWTSRKTRAHSDSLGLKRTANHPIALRSLVRDEPHSRAAVYDTDDNALLPVLCWILFCHLSCILHCRRLGRRDDLNRNTDQVTLPGCRALSLGSDNWTASYKPGKSPVLRCGDKQQTSHGIDRSFGSHFAQPVKSTQHPCRNRTDSSPPRLCSTARHTLERFRAAHIQKHPLLSMGSFPLSDFPASNLHSLERLGTFYDLFIVKHICHLIWTFRAWLGGFQTDLRYWIPVWLTWTYICIATAYPYAGRTHTGYEYHGSQSIWQQPTSNHATYQPSMSNIGGSGGNGGDKRKPSGNGSDSGPSGDPHFPNPSSDGPEDDRWCHCVYHGVHSPDPDPYVDCGTLKKFVSNMTVHNERHGLLYCLICWARFYNKDDRKTHTDNHNCGPKRCVHGGLFGVVHDCHNYNQDPPYSDRPCAHSKRLDQTYSWAKIYRLAFARGPHDHVPLPPGAPRPDVIGSQPMVPSHTAPPRISDERSLGRSGARAQAGVPSEPAPAGFQPRQGLSDPMLPRSDLLDSAGDGFNEWADRLRDFIGNLWEMCNQPMPRLIPTHLQYLDVLAPHPGPVLAGPLQVLTLVNFRRLLARSMVEIIVNPDRQTQNEWRLLRAMVSNVLTSEEFGNPPQAAPWVAAYIYQDDAAFNNLTGGEAYRAENNIEVNLGVPLDGRDMPPILGMMPDHATGSLAGRQPNTTEHIMTHPHGNNHELVNDSIGQGGIALDSHARYGPEMQHPLHNPSAGFPPPPVPQVTADRWPTYPSTAVPDMTPPEIQPSRLRTGSVPQARSVNAMSPPSNRPAPSMTRSATHVPVYHPYAHPDHRHRRTSQRQTRRPSQIPLPSSDLSAVTTNLSSDPFDQAYSPDYDDPGPGFE